MTNPFKPPTVMASVINMFGKENEIMLNHQISGLQPHYKAETLTEKEIMLNKSDFQIF